MKKLLASLLCSIPLIANAVNIGGFEFKKEDVYGKYGKNNVVAYTTEGDKLWLGWYVDADSSVGRDGAFVLLTPGRGNKVWTMISMQKGKYFLRAKQGDVKSVLELSELDCAEGKSRRLKVRMFSDYFLKGNTVGNDINTVGDWEYHTDVDLPIVFGCSLKEVMKKYR